MANSLTIYDSLCDEERRAIEVDIFQNPGDGRIVVKLEGKRDVRIFKHFGDVKKYRFERIGCSAGSNKQAVIDHVARNPDHMGVVDMDHDFESDMIKKTSRVVDTRVSCCLASLVLGQDKQEHHLFYQRIIRDSIKNPEDRKVAVSELRKGIEELHDFISELTSARLFRGHNRRIPRTDGELVERVKWSQIRDLYECITTSKIVPEEFQDEFQYFKRKYEDEINNAGPNDHDIEDALKIFIVGALGSDKLPERWRMTKAINDQLKKLQGVERLAPIVSKLANCS